MNERNCWYAYGHITEQKSLIQKNKRELNMELEKINTASIDLTCLIIRKLCEDYDRLNNVHIEMGMNNAERIEKHQKTVAAIKKRIKYLSEIIDPSIKDDRIIDIANSSGSQVQAYPCELYKTKPDN